MKRFFSHYTFISPNICFRNAIVELDKNSYISNIFGFEREIEHTEFYSGWLFFLENKYNIEHAYYFLAKDQLRFDDVQYINIKSITKIKDIYNVNNIQVSAFKHLSL